jgi:RNA polymerase sigma-70 factor, ECF subfamily
MHKQIGIGQQTTMRLLEFPEQQVELSPGFEELAMPLFDSLYNFAHWLTHSREDAEDLVQETFVKALKGFPSFHAGTNFKAWIHRILRNTFLTQRTALQSKMTIALDPQENGDELAVVCETAEMILVKSSERQQLQKAIEALPIHFRETLLLCDVEEMSYREIAETLLLPIGTVMSRLARAREALRFAMETASHASPLHSTGEPRCDRSPRNKTS